MIELTVAQLAAAWLNVEHCDGDVTRVDLRDEHGELVVDYYTGAAAPAMTVRVDRDGTASRTLTL